ncbi:beta-glucosidase [Mesorhizobium sp. NBSH29]|uniref:glucoamylase family protein n=1 Tax=Mesorhizobium sp. NBSH29 TaxID=2654249 RepID=UPI0018964C75|nr:glucoamylase family protein [Mesorhizobium sp. NBSH29]QPC86364.1 beta-glucosidase [Mesorhizobium sp. NBSH29]
MTSSSHVGTGSNAEADSILLDLVQRQTFRFFWEGAHPLSGLARDRQKTTGDPDNDLVAVGGSGFGIMAVIVAVERGWITRHAAVGRLDTMLSFLERTPRYHGMFPHFIDGRTAATIPFKRKDDGGDVVESAFLFQGLLCARQYFDQEVAAEQDLRDRINQLWREAEWDWYTRGGENRLYWHWSPNHGWAMNRLIVGWDECLLAFVLAAGSPEHAVDADVYHEGYATGPGFRNGQSYHGITLPLGMPYGGPLFIAHYSFCSLDPRGLTDRHADYWEQNVRHTRINHAHCVANPYDHSGYGPDCWGLTSSHGPKGYVAHAPDKDLGVITPSASLSSFPYAPVEAMRALRGFLTKPERRIWGRFGFVDALCENSDWYARTYLAINQGPIIIMIENFRTGLLWNLFMSAPEVRSGLFKLGFQSPHLSQASVPRKPVPT